MIIKLDSYTYKKFENNSGSSIIVQVIPKLFSSLVSPIKVGDLVEYEEIIYKVTDKTNLGFLVEAL